MRDKRWFGCLAITVVAFLPSACGDDSPDAVPFDSIPKDKKLVDLSPGERQGACQWAGDVARQKLGSATCGGQPLTLSGCVFPSGAQCTATVGQWEVCLPNVFGELAKDPCQLFSFAFSPNGFSDFVNGIPGCEGQGACTYQTTQ
jgi:hypothetical protein